MTAHAAQLSPEEFRDAIGHFASGVTVITAAQGGRRFGSTASAVSSLSLEPPMLLVCLNRQSATGRAVAEAGHFAVNVLSQDQGALARQFASKADDKFAGLDVTPGERGVPLLADALAHYECRVAEHVTGGTHSVFLAEVHAVRTREGEAPLAYFRGEFGRLELQQDSQAHARLRAQLLDRRLPIGEPLDAEALASELELSPKAVRRALAKLSGEGLVERDENGEFIIAPLNFAAVEAAFRARLAIQLGAADLTVGRLDQDELAELRRLMDATLAVDPTPMGVWLQANGAFHERMIELAGSPALLDSYRRLMVPGIMSRSLLTDEHADPAMAAAHQALMEAYEHGDLDAARAALIRDTDAAIALHRDRLAAVGGAI
ncbi:MAG: flavin reductase [Solirubrobacterales bacterium]|nr:flavin reductase [Solirubrobacterales bacterium]MBV9716029.1 flavin reductase [Solirubrobacterales bacterium]